MAPESRAAPGSAPTSARSANPIPELLAAFRRVRAATEDLAAPLSPEDQTAQSMPDVSPTKWHRAHTTWFFETFVLERFEADFEPVDPRYRMLFNSYYEAVGPQYPRPERGVITRPGIDEIAAYRHAVDHRVEALLDTCDDHERARALAEIVTIGLHHEQQHQELLLMDIKHVLSLNPLEPEYHPGAESLSHITVAAGWAEISGGVVDVGHDGAGFAFDNELPRHRAYLEPFELSTRLVTTGEWCDFIADGGYERPELWLSDGWARVNDEGWDAPLYWRHDSSHPSESSAPGSWRVHTLAGTRPVSHDEPVTHVSHYEADAFARWAGARLPTEFEWEHAATTAAADLSQLHGTCWQWTSSAYLPYPGFEPAAGAVGEYNGKFMSGQMVLRGSSSLTPPDHARTTYRNFFPPGARWAMSGVRLARSATS